MGRYGRLMPTAKATSLLRKAVKPMHRRAKAEAPVSFGGRERIRIAPARAAIARGSNPNYLRQGGATKRDVRVKSVNPEPKELGRVLVGVSKKSRHVGWRTIFITRGTRQRRTKKGQNRGRITANNFLQRTFDSTISMVRADFFASYRVEFIQWAKTTWPQITK